MKNTVIVILALVVVCFVVDRLSEPAVTAQDIDQSVEFKTLEEGDVWAWAFKEGAAYTYCFVDSVVPDRGVYFSYDYDGGIYRGSHCTGHKFVGFGDFKQIRLGRIIKPTQPDYNGALIKAALGIKGKRHLGT